MENPVIQPEKSDASEKMRPQRLRRGSSGTVAVSGPLLVMLVIVGIFVTAGIYVLTGSPVITIVGLALSGVFLACLLLFFRGGGGRRGAG